MSFDWDTLMFIAIWLGLFAVLPICAVLGVKYFFTGAKRRLIINLLGGVGLSISAYMIAVPLLEPATHPGGMAILILIPLAGLLALTCSVLLWRNNRSR